MVRVEVVERKLEALSGYLAELQHIRPVSLFPAYIRQIIAFLGTR